MAPPVVVMAAAVKPLGASEKVKVIVAVCPAIRPAVLVVIARLGACVSTAALKTREERPFTLIHKDLPEPSPI